MVQAFYEGFRVTDINAFSAKTVEISTTDSQNTVRRWVCPNDIILVDLPEERTVYCD